MINSIADSLCNCRFESTYTTTEESVYQNLLDIILTCIRCDAGVLLTKKRAWCLVETVYNMAFQRSVTPVNEQLCSHVVASEVCSEYADSYNPHAVLSSAPSGKFQLRNASTFVSQSLCVFS